jgi:hypothetical protein
VLLAFKQIVLPPHELIPVTGVPVPAIEMYPKDDCEVEFVVMLVALIPFVIEADVAARFPPTVALPVVVKEENVS